ncbi:MAG: deoxyguanosinetriphosphate triphosphohydrolase [bacterium]|nr:deoxyguanosinetriphosphate triphosphohydrolase [bacterium]
MLIRERFEQFEKETLSPFATLSSRSKGRRYEEEECIIRTCFQRDRDRIVHSKSFRQLKHKTQVFLIPIKESIRTRLTHTIEVSQIARTIAKALLLNEDLTEAISLGHDLGHPPFGHIGEVALNGIYKNGFKHSEQSLRIVEILEKEGQGLNLTYEVKDGILKHSRGSQSLFIDEGRSMTLEGDIVRLADSIAYINHDIEDAINAGIIEMKDLPREAIRVLGERSSERIDRMVKDVIETSYGKDVISMSREIMDFTDELRNYLYSCVYTRNEIQKEAQKARRVLEELFNYFCKNPEEVLESLPFLSPEEGIDRIICDYLAGMSDQEALLRYEEIFLPRPGVF